MNYKDLKDRKEKISKWCLLVAIMMTKVSFKETSTCRPI